VPVRTRLVASPRELYTLRQVPAAPCRALGAVTLEEGENAVSARAGRWSSPGTVLLESDAPDRLSPAGDVRATFDGLERRLDPPAGAAYVALRENANPGWRATEGGRPVRPLVVDGWQQGWATDGSTRAVEVRFPADRVYRVGLGAGLLALVLLLGLALLRRRPGDGLAPVGPARVPPPVVVSLGALGAGLLAGWPGLACFMVALLAVVVVPPRGRPVLTWTAAGLVLVASAAYFLRPWGSVDGWAGSWAWPHYLVLTALSVAVAVAAGLRPRSLRPWQGSSTSR
jgi:arabinofuranan 3-O-arabinosyltransferase